MFSYFKNENTLLIEYHSVHIKCLSFENSKIFMLKWTFILQCNFKKSLPCHENIFLITQFIFRCTDAKHLCLGHDFDFEQIFGSGVPGSMSRNYLPVDIWFKSRSSHGQMLVPFSVWIFISMTGSVLTTLKRKWLPW